MGDREVGFGPAEDRVAQHDADLVCFRNEYLNSKPARLEAEAEGQELIGTRG